ncbi:MAG: ferritin family protein [Promethearchaeota archaeon]|jgi:rubrerythrin
MKETIKNLMLVFTYESQSRNQYELYAGIAKKEEFYLVSKIFREIADQEREHANWSYVSLQKLRKHEMFEKLLLEINSTTVYGTTIDNLTSAIEDKFLRWNEMYPEFAQIAKKEGNLEAEMMLMDMINNEKSHYHRFQMLLELVKSGLFMNQNEIKIWKCIECGYEVAQDELSDTFQCPSCDHFKPYFQKLTLMLDRDVNNEKTYWVCMECGYEAIMKKIPNNFKCPTCGRSKAYFRRKSAKYKDYHISLKKTEKAIWTCLECGNKEEVEMPSNWECPKCGAAPHKK